MDENNYLKFGKEWKIVEKFLYDEEYYESVIIFKSDGSVYNKTYKRNESWEFISNNKFNYIRNNITYPILFTFNKSDKEIRFEGNGISSVPGMNNSTINGSLYKGSKHSFDEDG